MGKYFQASQRGNPPTAAFLPEAVTPIPEGGERRRLTVMAPEQGSGLVRNLARNPALRRLGEQLAPLAVVDGSLHVLVSGCRPGDGASSIAAALAIDLSQRLAARTVLVECHLHHPNLKAILPRGDRDTTELVQGSQIALHPSGWPRLDTIGYALPWDVPLAPHLEDLAKLLDRYQAAVLDVGVLRNDARMLTLARPKDPILVVARYQQTERQELTSTVNAIRVSERKLAGVVLNGYKSPVPAFLRRFLGIGG